MNISVIIPNYNGENLLRKNLPKVFEEFENYNNGSIEVIVVDDASADNSSQVLEEFKKKYKNLKVFISKKNLGFSGNVNRGVDQADGDILLFLNTDVYPEKGFLQPLIQNFDDENIFAVGCMDKSLENEKITLRGRGLGKWQRGFLEHRRGEVDKKNTLWVSGGSGAFKKSIWDKLGGLNNIYNPFYWEDIDISYRAQKAGYKVIFEPKSIVIHEHDKGAIKSTYSTFKIRITAYRNQFFFVWTNATDIKLRIQHLIFIPYHILKAVSRLDLAFFIGFFTALIRLPEVIKWNIKTHNNFCVKDRDVIANLDK